MASSISKSRTVGLRCADINLMSADWTLIRALLSGTPGMREGASVWLPRYPRETFRTWRVRVSRAILYPAFEDAIDNLTDKPFSHAIEIKGDLPDSVAELVDNCDGAGTSLHNFSEDAWKSALTYGVVYGMADMPGIADGDSEKKSARTKADELNEMPYLTAIKATDMLGWKTRLTSKGLVLSQARFIERHTEEANDAYVESTVQYVRVVTETTWELWREVDQGRGRNPEWEFVNAGTHNFGRVPIRVLRFGKAVGFMGALPPMRGLAWLNLGHFQSDTDQENILSFVRVPMLHYAGGDEHNPADPEGYGEIVIGPNQVTRSRSPDAKLERVAYNGTEIKLGADSLRAKEQRMEILGLKPMIDSANEKTATGSKIDADDNDNSAKTWVRRTNEFILDLMSDAAQWKGEQLNDDVSIEIFDDFGVSSRAPAELAILQRDRERGDLSHASYLSELRRRGVYGPDIESESEIALLDDEIDTMSGLNERHDDLGDQNAE